MDTSLCTYTRRAALVVLAALLVGLAALTTPQLAPTASAYVLKDGCSEYDPDRNITYWCVPNLSTFYTPDGVDPTRVAIGTNYFGEYFSSSFADGGEAGPPPPAPYVAGRDYCSNSWFGWSPFEGIWQYTCYRHDVCYGSQLGRKYCDVNFWKNMASDCKSHYGWYDPTRYACLANAREWYYVVRWFGASHYKPRQTSFEPAGE